MELNQPAALHLDAAHRYVESPYPLAKAALDNVGRNSPHLQSTVTVSAPAANCG